MHVNATTKCLLLILLGAVPCGCRSGRLDPQHRSAQIRAQHDLVFAGEWSDPVRGVRCRIRLGSDHAAETRVLVSALEVWNDSNEPVEMNNTNASKFAACTVWTLEHELYFSNSVDLKKLPVKPVDLAPGERFLIGPARLRITPSIAPRIGAQEISASTLLRTDRLTSPPAKLFVAPADWGGNSNGLRLCMGSDASTVQAGDSISLFLYLHNTTNRPIEMLEVDWDHPRVRAEDDRITLSYQPARGSGSSMLSARRIRRQVLVLGGLLDRPGIYRFRVEIEVPPLNFIPKNVWTGTAVSNELTIWVEKG